MDRGTLNFIAFGEKKKGKAKKLEIIRRARVRVDCTSTDFVNNHFFCGSDGRCC